MTRVNQIHHIAIVVDRIEDALNLWETLGLEVETIKDVPEEEARVAFLPAGDTKIELVEPTTGSSGIARYLVKHGPGLHHLCLQVSGIDELLTQLSEKGFQLINPVAQIDTHGRKYAFIHPKSTQGVLVELYEAPA